MRHVLLSIKVTYDEATVTSMSVLIEALHRELADFVASGALVPLETEVVDFVSYKVEEINAV